MARRETRRRHDLSDGRGGATDADLPFENHKDGVVSEGKRTTVRSLFGPTQSLMFAKPARRPVPAKAPMPRHRGQSVGDALLIVAGCFIFIGVGYVAYRTQVVGEPIEKVIPFLGANRELAANPNTPAGPAKTTSGPVTPAGKPAQADKTTPADGADPDNTYFGRRTHSPSGVGKPAPSN